MQPSSVVEQLDKFEDGGLRDLAALEIAMVDEFILKCREETLRDRIIERAAFRAHARSYVMVGKNLAVTPGAVQDALIGMMGKTWARTALLDRHL